MKRLFTLLTLVLLFMVIPQRMSATDYWVMGDVSPLAQTDKDNRWNQSAILSSAESKMTQKGTYYVYTYKCTEADGYVYFRMLKEGGTQAGVSADQLMVENTEYQAEATNAAAFKIKAEVGHNYTIIINDTGWKVKYYEEKSGAYTYSLIGGIWSNENSLLVNWGEEPNSSESSFTYNDGKYTREYTASKTGEYRFRLNTSYLNDVQLCPTTSGTSILSSNTIDYTDNVNADNYWTLPVTEGKKYVFTLDEAYVVATNTYTRTLSVAEGGTVVTKEIKLLNGSSAIEGSNGKFSLDLSADGSSDAEIKITIDGVTYGLENTKVINAAGTTSGIAFKSDGENSLTLKAGFIYSITVTEDGEMTVVAAEKGVADGNYYLVGNFFNTDGDEIKYDKKYFRFVDNGDGTLTFDIPATLTVKAQVSASDGTIYGPVNGEAGYGISNTHPNATEITVDGKLTASSNYWTFTDRGLSEDGIYHVTITVDATGVPTDWKVEFDKTQRMAYFLADPTEVPAAVAHPCYAGKKDDGKSDNKFFGSVYMEANKHFFVIGNIQVKNDDSGVGILKTNNKLYRQGNGGLDITTNTEGTTDGWKYTNVFPNKDKGFFIPTTRTLILEYNPSAGNQTYEEQNRRSSNLRGLHETRLTKNHADSIHEEWYVYHSM